MLCNICCAWTIICPAFKHLELLQIPGHWRIIPWYSQLMQWLSALLSHSSTLLSHSSMKDPPFGGVKNLKLGDRLVPPTIFPATLWDHAKTVEVRQRQNQQKKNIGPPALFPLVGFLVFVIFRKIRLHLTHQTYIIALLKADQVEGSILA